MKNLLKAGTVCGLAIFATLSTSNLNNAQACGPDPYVGTMCWTVASFCPSQYVPADGRLLQINQFQLAFAVTGVTYGGDGQNTFGVPNARQRELVHAGQGPGLDLITRGEMTGWEMATVPEVYFPAHKHEIDLSSATISAGVYASKDVATELSPANNYFGDTTTTAPNYSATSNSYMAVGSVNAVGQQGSGNIDVTTNQPAQQTAGTAIGPQLGLLTCVAVDGIYPPRS